MIEARIHAERIRPTWAAMEAILRGTLESRPLVELAGPERHDIRLPGLPMALYSKAAVAENTDSSEALRAVALVTLDEWNKGSWRSRERCAERALWVVVVMVQRSARMLAHIDGGSSGGIDLAQIERLCALVSKLPTAWSVRGGSHVPSHVDDVAPMPRP